MKTELHRSRRSWTFEAQLEYLSSCPVEILGRDGGFQSNDSQQHSLLSYSRRGRLAHGGYVGGLYPNVVPVGVWPVRAGHHGGHHREFAIVSVVVRRCCTLLSSVP